MRTDFQKARQAQYIGFLHRYPFAADAYELGFAVGVREDYSYQAEDYPTVDLPVVILDNDFHPDIDRYLERFEEYDPTIGILGDAYTPQEAEELNATATEWKERYPHKEFVVVPKCREAVELLDENLVLGYPMGYSDVLAEDFSKPVDWRGRRIHLLGASPLKQYEMIQTLTQPTLTGDPPADIVGLDWNGLQKVAYKGEYWTPQGWKNADHLSVRETVRRSLEEIKRFWQEQGVWPETEPVELYGPAVEEPEEPLYVVNSADIESREMLEDSIVEEYEYSGDTVKWAFENEAEKAFREYREELRLAEGLQGQPH